MLTKFDEYLCHQTVSTFEEVGTSDRNWTEKIYLCGLDSSGQTVVCAGFGKYPNRNVMDAFGGAALVGRQYTVRASRELRPDVDSVQAGPLSYEVVEPLKRVRICLGENDYGVSFEIEFDARVPPMEEPGGISRIRGAIVNHTIRYYQMGHIRGKLKVEDKTYEIKKDNWHATRDHSWGIRAMCGVPPAGSFYFREGMGVPESGLQPVPATPGLLGGVVHTQFRNYSLFYTYAEGPDGKPMRVAAGTTGGFVVYPYGDPRPPMEIKEARFQWEFFPGTRQVKSAEAVMGLADGAKKEISIKPLGPIFSLRAGGYFGFRGWWQGKWVGPHAVEGEKLDLTDNRVLSELRDGIEETACQYKCGSEIGYGILEVVAAGELPGYGLKRED